MKLLARPNCGTGLSLMVHVARGAAAPAYRRGQDAVRAAVAQAYRRAPDQAALGLSSNAARTQLRAHDRVYRLRTVH